MGCVFFVVSLYSRLRDKAGRLFSVHIPTYRKLVSLLVVVDILLLPSSSPSDRIRLMTKETQPFFRVISSLQNRIRKLWWEAGLIHISVMTWNRLFLQH